jgi:acetyl-CoA carboxylase carboxyltransferase component
MNAPNPDEMRKTKVLEYTEKFANPYIAAANGHVDAVISPSETREFIIHSLKISENKTECRAKKKHGIPPF